MTTKYILNSILCLFLLFLPVFLNAQVNEEEGIAYKRSQWFMGQRQFPADSIPQNAYNDAITYRNDLSAVVGVLTNDKITLTN